MLYFFDNTHRLHRRIFRAITPIFNRALACDCVKLFIEVACCILALMSASKFDSPYAVPLVLIFIVFWEYVFNRVKCTIESAYSMLASISAVRNLCILVKTAVEILSLVFIQVFGSMATAWLIVNLLRFLRGVAGTFLLEVVYFLVYGRRLER